MGAWRSRWHEGRVYKRLLDEYRHRGATIVTAPKPIMTDELYVQGYTEGFEDIEDRHKKAAKSEFVTTENEICFDAADFMRAGRHFRAAQSSHQPPRHPVDERFIRTTRFQSPSLILLRPQSH